MEYPSYKYPVESLTTGSSLGNLFAFARFDAETNLKGLWSSTDNQFYAGEWDTELVIAGTRMTALETTISPESQMTRFVDQRCEIEKQCLLPFYTQETADLHAGEMRSIICLLRCKNISESGLDLLIRHSITFPAVRSGLFTKHPPEDQTDKRVAIHQRTTSCEITTVGSALETRIFGTSIPWTRCTSDDRSLVAEYTIHVEARKEVSLRCVLSFSPNGVEEAIASFQRCLDGDHILTQSISEYKNCLSRSHIVTPEPLINRGLQWAKVNTLRVQHRYRIGEAFTNDPPQDIVVVRDLAWYILGSDYLTPEFSRDLLGLTERYAYHEGGKLTEYFHANEEQPVQHDYNLNINDDTPLFVYALYRHALTCADEYGLERVYPLMKRACEWILLQIHDGLVKCYADGINVWGICSWRNIIDNYNLTGAVTEINAECYYALHITAETAKHLLKPDDARRFSRAAERLKQKINKELLSTQTGMYLLNTSNNGLKHHDITGDLIFPVMFNVADDSMSATIVSKLTDSDMWTAYGSRTVSKTEKNYDPDFGYQLVGGLWHNLMAWIAYCARNEQPELLVEGMKNIYRICESPCPRDFQNVVPGHFPERLHGETFASRGMTMSPWTPPTYLWLGVEGLFGVRGTFDGLEMNPTIPEGWSWIGVKNLLYKGKSIDAFFSGGTLYSTYPVISSYPSKVGSAIEIRTDTDALFVIAMNVANETIIFAASDRETSGTISANVNGTHFDKLVHLKTGQHILIHPANANSQAVMEEGEE